MKYFKLPALAEQMQAYINDIEQRAEVILDGCEGKKIRFGADYIVCAKPKPETSSPATPPAPLGTGTGTE